MFSPSLALYEIRSLFHLQHPLQRHQRPVTRLIVDANDVHRVPASRFSKLQQRCARLMRYIVAHMQTIGERK